MNAPPPEKFSGPTFATTSVAVAAPEAATVVLAQAAGAYLGVGAAFMMLGRPVFTGSIPARATTTKVVGDLLATLGLLCILRGGSRGRRGATTPALAVGAYLASIYGSPSPARLQTRPSRSRRDRPQLTEASAPQTSPSFCFPALEFIRSPKSCGSSAWNGFETSPGLFSVHVHSA